MKVEMASNLDRPRRPMLAPKGGKFPVEVCGQIMSHSALKT